MNRDPIVTFPELSLMTDSDLQFLNCFLQEARLRCHDCQVAGIAISIDCDLKFLRTFKQYPCSCCSQSLGNQPHTFEIHPYGSYGSVSWIHGHQNVQLHFITFANGAPPLPSQRWPPTSNTSFSPSDVSLPKFTNVLYRLSPPVFLVPTRQPTPPHQTKVAVQLPSLF
jgi:hypothetical protein